MSDAAITPETDRAEPSVGAIFMGFLGVGLIGFGGVLPLARRMIVEQRRWLNPAEFTDLLALCQFLPGGNIINLCAALGQRFRGLPGAVAALAGLMAAPAAVVILLGLAMAHFAGYPVVHRLFAGLAAGASGLIVAVSLKLAAPLRRNPLGIGIALLCFLATGVLRLPLLATMLVLAPVSILLAWRWRQ